MSRRRVVVTGLGCVSPVGNTVEASWAALLAGKSGIAKITGFDASAFTTHFAGEVKDFNIEDYIPEKEARHMGRFIHMGMAAACQAVADSGLATGDALSEEEATRIGCNIGSGIGGLPTIEATHIEYVNRGPRRITPFFVPASIINMISGNVSIKFGFKGPNIAVVTACTTGLHAIGTSARMIEYGDCDVMIAGGAEATTSPLGLGGFAAARALSTRNDDPATASRPWDKDRDGFVLGEGAGVLVLEEYEHAKARGAKIYAEVAGFGMTGDAYHMTAPNVDGPRRSMQMALKNAGVNADSVHYINAHGTSTPLGDLNETNAIKLAFGDHAKKTVVNSTKSMTGHLLGGAGGIESVFTALAIFHQKSPPTINIFNQDPECDLDYCANTARDLKIEVAVKTTLALAAPTVLWSSNACVNFLNHHLAPAVSYATGGAGYLRWLLAGIVLLGAASLGLFGYFSGSASKLLTWQWVLLAGVWLFSTAAAWRFLRHLPQGELDFDGENWYFENKVDQIDQVGTVSVRFDGQSGMLLRFENEFNRVHWLWLEERFSSNHWHDLRRAVYSRPALRNSLHLI